MLDCSWTKIKEALSGRISSVQDFLGTTLKYYKSRSLTFNVLEYALDQLPKNDRLEFFSNSMPIMQKCVLNLDSILPTPPPLLRDFRKCHVRSLTVSSEQALCLMSCAFFGLFPKMDSDFQSFNFRR